jgi:DNA polymerase-1
VSVEEAERLLNRYFKAYPQVKQYLEGSAKTAIERGWAETLGGRKLFLQIGERMEGPDLAAISRVAKNMPIQGTNADMLKVAMAGIRRRLLDGGPDAFMVNCVHDEILLEAEDGGAWDAAEIVKEEMVKAGERYVKKVPMVVDVSVGNSWLK